MKVYRLKPDQPENTEASTDKSLTESEKLSSRFLDFSEVTRRRRILGFRLGIVVGLCFGFVAELLNLYLIPGVLLSSPPLGALGNFFLCGLFGAFIGWVVAYPHETFTGVSLGSLVCIAVTEFRAWITPGSTPMLRMLMNPVLIFFVLLTFCLVVLLLSPFMFLWRSSLEMQVENFVIPWWSWRKIRLILLLLGCTGFAGSYFILPNETRMIILQMDELVQNGVRSNRLDQLPVPLQNKTARDILAYTDEVYTIDIMPAVDTEDEVSNRSFFNRAGFSDRITLAARFRDGWSLICSYQSPESRPYCHGERFR